MLSFKPTGFNNLLGDLTFGAASMMVLWFVLVIVAIMLDSQISIVLFVLGTLTMGNIGAFIGCCYSAAISFAERHQ